MSYGPSKKYFFSRLSLSLLAKLQKVVGKCIKSQSPKLRNNMTSNCLMHGSKCLYFQNEDVDPIARKAMYTNTN